MFTSIGIIFLICCFIKVRLRLSLILSSRVKILLPVSFALFKTETVKFILFSGTTPITTRISGHTVTVHGFSTVSIYNWFVQLSSPV